MSEITKLYENAGIEKCNSTLKDIIPNICLKECEEETYKCKDCEHFEYPSFTAEKQLALIIFLANREIRISPTYISSGYYLNNFSKIKSSRNISTFENSLAQHINALWQDLTEEDKTSIKNILEM